MANYEEKEIKTTITKATSAEDLFNLIPAPSIESVEIPDSTMTDAI